MTWSDVPVEVVDPDGDGITLEAANGLAGLPLPSFVTFTDYGNGMGLFHFDPGPGDRGNYTLSGDRERRWQTAMDGGEYKPSSTTTS